MTEALLPKSESGAMTLRRTVQETRPSGRAGLPDWGRDLGMR